MDTLMLMRMPYVHPLPPTPWAPGNGTEKISKLPEG